MLAQHCKQYVNDKLNHANMKICHYNYALGQKVLKKVHGQSKLRGRPSGPYTIDQAHVNGTLTIELHICVAKCINIYKIILYQKL